MLQMSVLAGCAQACTANTIAPLSACSCHGRNAKPKSELARPVKRHSGLNKHEPLFIPYSCAFCLHSSLLLLTQTNLGNIVEAPISPCLSAHTRTHKHTHVRTQRHANTRVARSRVQNAQQADQRMERGRESQKKKKKREGRMQGEARSRKPHLS